MAFQRTSTNSSPSSNIPILAAPQHDVLCKRIEQDPKKTYIQFLNLKGPVNRKFKTRWVPDYPIYLGALTLSAKTLPNLRMHRALPKKGIWSSPCPPKG